MNWNKLQLEAKEAGALVFAMDQAQTEITNMPGPWGNAYSGFCSGCAVHWIALRYSGKDFNYDPKTYEVDIPDWKTVRNQNLYEDGPGDFPDNLALPFAEYGLTVNRGRLTEKKEKATGPIVLNAGLAGEGCYYISLRSPGGVGHAVAMQNLGKGKWRFFDANNGEFQLPDNDDLKGLFDRVVSGYRTKFDASVGIVGVNPPPAGRPFAAIKKLGSRP